MVDCWDCGNRYKSRDEDDIIEVYDEDNRIWTEECPNCGSRDFEQVDHSE